MQKTFSFIICTSNFKSFFKLFSPSFIAISISNFGYSNSSPYSILYIRNVVSIFTLQSFSFYYKNLFYFLKYKIFYI